jgi:hypothetical protein
MREGTVRKSPRMMALLALVTALVWVGAGMAAQMTGGQARAAQNMASQAASGGAPKGAAPAAAAPAAAAPTQSSSAQAPPAASGGRRDPFRPLIIQGPSDQLPARLPPGKAGLVIGQLTIQGIVRGLNGQWIAVVDNKTNRAYFLYAGDELYNGSVSRITQNNVVFQERVADPSGPTRTREVVKQLSPN